MAPGIVPLLTPEAGGLVVQLSLEHLDRKVQSWVSELASEWVSERVSEWVSTMAASGLVRHRIFSKYSAASRCSNTESRSERTQKTGFSLYDHFIGNIYSYARLKGCLQDSAGGCLKPKLTIRDPQLLCDLVCFGNAFLHFRKQPSQM